MAGQENMKRRMMVEDEGIGQGYRKQARIQGISSTAMVYLDQPTNHDAQALGGYRVK